MDIEAIIWFAAVARLGSFAEAARYLKQPSSNVSRRIAKLEADLGYKLMQRTTRSLVLTEQGRQLLPMAQRLTDTQTELKEWQQSQQEEPAGVLRITAPGSFARGPLNDWLLNYRKAYPKVKTELIHSNDYLDFQQHQLDVAFRQGPLGDSTLIAKRLFGIEYGVFANPGWLASQSVPECLTDLLKLPLICVGVKGQTLPWRFKSQTLHPKNPDMLFDDPEQCARAAMAGLGCTYTSRFEVRDALKSGALIELFSEQKAEPVNFYMVYAEREYISKKTQSFLRFIEQEVEAFGGQEGVVV